MQSDEFEYHFACRRKDVHLCFITSPGKDGEKHSNSQKQSSQLKAIGISVISDLISNSYSSFYVVLELRFNNRQHHHKLSLSSDSYFSCITLYF